MRTFSIDRYRNIGVLAHIDAGKTTCSERILFYTGKIHRIGEVHHGQAAMDSMAEERRRGITISAAATVTHWAPLSGPGAGVEHRIQLIDTPGHVDFTVEVERSLRVLDGAVVVLDASQGVEPQTEAVWRQADRHGVPRVAFVNKVDKVGASVERCVSELRQRLGAAAAAVQLPLGEEGRFAGVIDLVRRRSLSFSGDPTERPREGEVPAALREATEQARALLVERCSEVDDGLLALYLGGEPVGDDELALALRRATVAGRFVPVLCGSALKNRGIEPLLDAIVQYLPSPADRPPVRGVTPGGQPAARAPADDQPLCAVAFKLTHDRSLGHVTWLRLYAGALATGDPIENATRGAAERAGRIMTMHAAERNDIQSCHTGDIVAVAGLKGVRTGDTLTAPGHPLVLAGLAVPEPVMAVALEPPTLHDQSKLSAALHRMALEDPSLRVGVDEETGRALLEGMGELHLEIALSRLASEHGVAARAAAPAVAYRSTLAGPARVEHRFVHQNGGRGQFAHVVVVFEPRAQGEGFAFVDEVKGGVIPREFIPAVEKGIALAMSRGLRGGPPVVDVRARLVDGSAHAKDSSSLAFEVAGSLAFRDAADQAGLVTLEPIMDVEVIVPEESTGDALGDLNARRGQVASLGLRSGAQVIRARVPLAELWGYAGRLRALTRGRGTFSMTPSHYARAPGLAAGRGGRRYFQRLAARAATMARA